MRTDADLPATILSVPEALAFRAERTPDAIALLAPEWQPTTYRELGAAVERLATELRGRGLGRRDAIALLLPEGPELCLALLAAIAAGIAVPVVWPHPKTELRRALANRRVRAVLVAATLPSPLPALADRGPPVITFSSGPSGRVGDFTLDGPGWTEPVPATLPAGDDIAVILHSSGTTGPPKLVPLLHRTLVATSRAVAETRSITAVDRCLVLARVAYTQGLLNLMTTIVAGAAFVCVSKSDSTALAAWVNACRPTYISTTPAVLRTLAADRGELRDALREAALRCITSTAGPLSAGELQHLESTLGAAILNIYGMTEMALIAGESFPALDRVPGAVGPARCEIRIVDEEGRDLGPGASGEIVIRGERVFPGYLDDPAANAAAFLPGGWFRTGDVGFLDAAGRLYLSGRLGEVINRGGEKIAPRDVDDALVTHPAVADAAAFAVPDSRLGEDIVAAVVFRPGMKVSARALRRWLLQRLAPHQTPRRIWEVARLPRTATGKVQRGELVRRWHEVHG